MLALLLSAMFLACTGPVTAQSPFPDGIRFIEGPSVIQAGENTSILMQVQLGGGDYPKGSIGIYMASDNTSVIDIPEVAMTATNQSGIAQYNLTAGQLKPGKANVTAILLDKKTGARVAKTFTVAKSGDIAGSVMDSQGAPAPGASVTLYRYSNGTAQIFGNPTVSSPGTPSSYRFSNVPYDSYYLEAGIGDNKTGINYTLGDNAAPADIVIAGYTVATPTPVPTATPEPTTQATTAASAAPAPVSTPASQDETRQVVWIGGLAVILAILIIVIVVLTRMK